MDIIDNKYLLKTLVELVRDENIRIVSAGLATANDIKRLTDFASEIIVKEADGRPDMLLGTLAAYHRRLAAVKLPGDFKEITAEIGLKDETKDKLSELLDENKEDDKHEEESDKEYEIVVAEVVYQLEKIAYNLGSVGNHDAAYLVERCVNEIKNVGKI
jgi:hypothetical protein